MNAGHGMIGHTSTLKPNQFLHLSSGVSVGPFMTSPLMGEGAPRGAIVVGRHPDGRAFTPIDLDVTESFANQAALALELSDNRADQQRLTLLEDRGRIARDLHDHVIQRLFATGLFIRAAASMVPDPEVNARFQRSVEDLDETIKQIRMSIFQLRDATEESSIRNSVLQVVEEAVPALGVTPRVRFDGPLDTVVQPNLVDDVRAVVREALTNAAKHAHASTVDVEITTDVATLMITVADDGTGMADTDRRSGLANLETRAERRGGNLMITERPGGGTEFRWTVPVS
jgi:signal transduction histidine kinase